METPTFSNVKFMSATDKEKILKAFNRFVKSDFAWSCFSKALYDHLYLHCGFIAHFNRLEFWNYYFQDFFKTSESNDERFQEFLIAFVDQDTEHRFGDRFCVRSKIEGVGKAIPFYNRDYLDINLAISDVVKNWLEERFNKPAPFIKAKGFQGSLFNFDRAA
jgi:hypothetical protein